jgi:hypothetical protein
MAGLFVRCVDDRVDGEGIAMCMYLLLYSGGGMPKTEEETTAMTEAWGAWLAGIGDALVDGNPFTPNAKSVSPTGRSQMVPSARWCRATR